LNTKGIHTEGGKEMKAEGVLHYFLSRADWFDKSTTVDKIIMGDPNKEIHKVLVTWMSTLAAIRYAAENGFDMLMTHEPTFWIHANELEGVADWEPGYEKQEAAKEKKRVIDESGLVVLRNHDVWDRMPKVGIPWALADFLGFGTTPVKTGSGGYQHRYDIEPVTLGTFSQKIAAKTALIGEPRIQVFGDMNTKVSKIGVGTGCCCNIESFIKMGCDVSIVCDDGNWYWQDIVWAQDIGHPLVRINHGTSEEPGMVTLAKYINENMRGMEAEYFPHSCGYQVIGG
jgi:putative NIF3 family GTP cyclohydrolase 1 type 2